MTRVEACVILLVMYIMVILLTFFGVMNIEGFIAFTTIYILGILGWIIDNLRT